MKLKSKNSNWFLDMYVCSIIYICNITASYFRKLVRHFQYSIIFDPLLRSAKSVDLCQGAPSIRERSDLHKLAVELLQVITTTKTTWKQQKQARPLKTKIFSHQSSSHEFIVLRIKCSWLNSTTQKVLMKWLLFNVLGF